MSFYILVSTLTISFFVLSLFRITYLVGTYLPDTKYFSFSFDIVLFKFSCLISIFDFFIKPADAIFGLHNFLFFKNAMAMKCDRVKKHVRNLRSPSNLV